jgi:hypothetical protein
MRDWGGREGEIKGRGKVMRKEKEEKNIHGNLLSSGQVWNNKQKWTGSNPSPLLTEGVERI